MQLATNSSTAESTAGMRTLNTYSKERAPEYQFGELRVMHRLLVLMRLLYGS